MDSRGVNLDVLFIAGIMTAIAVVTKSVTDFYQTSINYFLKHGQNPEELKEQLDTIKNYFSDDQSLEWQSLTTTYDRKQWQQVYIAFLDRANEIIKDVLKYPIEAF